MIRSRLGEIANIVTSRLPGNSARGWPHAYVLRNLCQAVARGRFSFTVHYLDLIASVHSSNGVFCQESFVADLARPNTLQPIQRHVLVSGRGMAPVPTGNDPCEHGGRGIGYPQCVCGGRPDAKARLPAVWDEPNPH